LPVGQRRARAGAGQPGAGLALRPGVRRQLSRRRQPVGLPTDGRRRVGVDGFGLPALSGLPRLPVPRVLGGLLRLRVQGPARRLVGHPPQRRAHHLPELGLPDPAPHLRRLPLREGRVTGRVGVDAFLIDADLDAALREDARRGLTSVPKELPPKWFYDERGSKLFDEITRLPEYYPTRREREILVARAPAVAATGADTLVELGSGTSEKTRLLLDAMAGAGHLRRFVPFDVSEATLRQAAETVAAEYPGVAVHAIVGDFEHHLGKLPGGG